MRKYIIIKLLVFSFILQCVTYSFCSRGTLGRSIIKNRVVQVIEPPKILLVSGLSKRNFRKSIFLFGDEYDIIDEYNDYSSEKYNGETICHYRFDVANVNFFVANVTDANFYRTFGEEGVYAEGYSSKYFWLLFVWINIEHTSSWQT